MSIKKLIIPSALLVLSSQATLGLAGETAGFSPAITQIYTLMEAGKAQSAAGQLSQELKTAKEGVQIFITKQTSGQALTQRDTTALQNHLDMLGQIFIAKDSLLTAFGKQGPETPATAQQAAQTIRQSEAAYNAAEKAAQAAIKGGCATYFANGLPFDPTLFGQTAAPPLSPQQLKAETTRAKNASGTMFLTEEVVKACTPYLLKMQQSPTTPQAQTKQAAAPKAAEEARAPQSTMDPDSPHGAIRSNIRKAAQEMKDGNCSEAIQSIAKAKETAVYSFNKLSEMAHAQGFITQPMLDEHEKFLEESSLVASAINAYTTHCATPMPETKKTSHDAEKITKEAQDSLVTATENSALAAQGACQEVFKRGGLSRPHAPWETIGSGGLSPLQLDAMKLATQNEAKAFLEMRTVIQNCRGPLLDLRYPK